MKRTLTPDVFRQRTHLEEEFQLSYNKKSKMLTVEKYCYASPLKLHKRFKEIFKYSNSSEDEFDNLTFIDCVNKIKSDTHNYYFRYTYFY